MLHWLLPVTSVILGVDVSAAVTSCLVTSSTGVGGVAMPPRF